MATGWFPDGTKMKKRSAIFAAALAVLVGFGAGCGATERDHVAEPSPTVTPAMTPPEGHPSPSTTAAPEWLAAGATNRVAEITGAPNAFLGKTVTVVSEVDDVYGQLAFTLKGDGPGKDMLTLVPKVGGFPKIDAQWKGGKARVTGVVQPMIPKDVEREIGWVMPLDLESKFRGRPVLIVRSVERLAK
jgi:hypothetical protein